MRRNKPPPPLKKTRVVDGIVLTQRGEGCFWFIDQQDNATPLQKTITNTCYTTLVKAIWAIRNVKGKAI